MIRFPLILPQGSEFKIQPTNPGLIVCEGVVVVVVDVVCGEDDEERRRIGDYWKPGMLAKAARGQSQSWQGYANDTKYDANSSHSTNSMG